MGGGGEHWRSRARLWAGLVCVAAAFSVGRALGPDCDLSPPRPAIARHADAQRAQLIGLAHDLQPGALCDPWLERLRAVELEVIERCSHGWPRAATPTAAAIGKE